MTDGSSASTTLRTRQKEEVRQRIVDAMLELMAEGLLDISHDLVAERAEVSRRTVYRYFPDREALLKGAWARIDGKGRQPGRFPTSVEALIESLPGVYAGLDRMAPLAILVRSSPHGRAMRLSQRARRAELYTAATAELVRDLPPDDRRVVTAVLQMIHTTPWLEMRDTWDMAGPEIARAVMWVMRTLVADIERRGGRAIDEPIASAPARPDHPKRDPQR